MTEPNFPNFPNRPTPTPPALRPCPICGHELAPRTIPLRDWLLHPFRSRRRQQFDRGYPASHILINHGESETVHELSSSAYAVWGVSPKALEKMQLQDPEAGP